MEQATKDKLAVNVGASYKMASNWVMTAAGAVATIWFAMPPEQQAELVKHSFVPPWAYPIALTVLGIAARLWPQFNLSANEASAKSMDAVTDVTPFDSKPVDPQ